MQIDTKSVSTPPLVAHTQRQVGLLVSVRSLSEAMIAWKAGANVIDIKEPLNGPLGAASPAVWRSICDALPEEVPITIALGEAIELDRGILSEIPSRVSAIKFGPGGCGEIARYWELLDEVSEASGRRCVRVAYADHERAKSPAILSYLKMLHPPQNERQWLLIDTFQKDQLGLMHWMSHASLSEVYRCSQADRFSVVLAGQLTACQFEKLRDIPPQLLAVRGAACQSDRSSGIDHQRVIDLVEKIRDIWPRGN